MVVATGKPELRSTRLRWFRKFYEYSLDEVSRETGIDRSTLSRVERGLIEATPQVKRALDEGFGEGQADSLLERISFSQYVSEQDD